MMAIIIAFDEYKYIIFQPTSFFNIIDGKSHFELGARVKRNLDYVHL